MMRGTLAAACGIGLALGGPACAGAFAGPSALPTAVASRSTFVDELSVRGELRPLVSRLITAPSSGADLLIVELAANGAEVRAGEVVVRFDSTLQQRTLEQRRSELKQAESEMAQADAEGRRRVQAAEAELAQLRSALARARLDLTGATLVSRVEADKLALAVSDAEAHVRHAEQKVIAERQVAAADVAIARQKRDKAGYDVAETERIIASLTVAAPTAGQVSLMPNFRAGGPMSRSAPEFKRGDRAWFGAAIADLPDLSTVRMTCRVDEADRARIERGSAVSVRVDAIPDREFQGAISDISTVARPDFTTFPPVRNFDVTVSLDDTDPRIKSGMSASARVRLDELPDVVVIPASALFLREGATVVYVVGDRGVQARPVTVARRSKDQVALADGLVPGERFALADPAAEAAR